MGYRVATSLARAQPGRAGEVTSLNSLISLTYRHGFGNMWSYPDPGSPAGVRTLFHRLRFAEYWILSVV